MADQIDWVTLADNQISRRKWHLLGLSALGTAFLPNAGVAHGAENSTSDKGSKQRGLLMRHRGLEQLDTRTKTVVELSGELRMRDPDPNKKTELRRAEVKAKSTLDYQERIVFDESQLVGSVRQYGQADLENWISGSALSNSLRPECQQTIMLQRDGVWEQYCDAEPMDARETELVQAPINSAVLELLLPDEPAKPKSTWKIEADAAQQLFNLEAVHQSTLEVHITKVESGVATMEIEGKLEATANSVPTSLEVKGNFNAKLGSRCAVVTWVGLSLRENREISYAQPGFNITARIRLIREEKEASIRTTADQIRELAANEDDGRWLVRLQAISGRYTMLGDRRWTTYLDTGEEAILRLIENNTIIAQCNISRLPDFEEGKQLTLEGMQADIRTSLGDKFDQFLESAEKVTGSQLRHLRSVVMGQAEEVPIQWIYNHLSDDDGHRVALIYTMGGNVTDKFAAADEQMTSSLEIRKQTSDAPTVAPKQAEKIGAAESPTTKR